MFFVCAGTFEFLKQTSTDCTVLNAIYAQMQEISAYFFRLKVRIATDNTCYAKATVTTVLSSTKGITRMMSYYPLFASSLSLVYDILNFKGRVTKLL